MFSEAVLLIILLYCLFLALFYHNKLYQPEHQKVQNTELLLAQLEEISFMFIYFVLHEKHSFKEQTILALLMNLDAKMVNFYEFLYFLLLKDKEKFLGY